MPLRIVFMGTPAFAVPSLDILLRHGFEVVGVVTASDKYGGRGGKQLIESDVKRYAREHGLPILQPEKLRDPAFLDALRAWQADLQVVVAFRMLPEVVWAMPRLGSINLHGSLLPRYRGAAPINWAIMRGERETGVTSFFLRHDIDTGDILLQRRLPIGPDETAGQLHDRMMHLGAEAVLESLRRIEAGDYTLQPQDDALASKAPKLFAENCAIDFAAPSAQIYDFIRGLSPYPTAWTLLDGQVFKIFAARALPAEHGLPPGSVDTDGRSYLRFASADGFIEALEVQAQGRKRMAIKDFLNGYKLQGT